MKKFPPVLYAKREEDGDTHYFVTDERMEELSEAEPVNVATYVLKEAGSVKSVIEYSRKPAKR